MKLARAVINGRRCVKLLRVAALEREPSCSGWWHRQRRDKSSTSSKRTAQLIKVTPPEIPFLPVAPFDPFSVFFWPLFIIGFIYRLEISISRCRSYSISRRHSNEMFQK
jgi:hypothetical protein